MYTILCDGVAIYDNTLPMEEYQLVDPELTLEVNCSGSLVFTILPSNRGYDAIKINESFIQVMQDGEEIWAGRPIKEDVDFYNNKKYTCEGELGFLNDTTAPMGNFSNEKIWVPGPSPGIGTGYLWKVLINHTSAVVLNQTTEGVTDSVYDKRFYVGNCSFNGNMPDDTELRGETTFEALNKMITYTKCYVSIRKEPSEQYGTTKYIDFLKKSDLNSRINTQSIHFGENLMSFTKNFNWDIITACEPFIIFSEGTSLPQYDHWDFDPIVFDKDTIYTLYYASTRNYNIPGTEKTFKHKIYSQSVYSDPMVKQWGWISKSLEVAYEHDAFSEELVYNCLMEAAADYIDNYRTDYMTIEVSGFDLTLLGVNAEKLKFMHYTHIISEPHNFDDWLLITKMDIKLNKPEETTYTFGHTYTRYTSSIIARNSIKLNSVYRRAYGNQGGNA